MVRDTVDEWGGDLDDRKVVRSGWPGRLAGMSDRLLRRCPRSGCQDGSRDGVLAGCALGQRDGLLEGCKEGADPS
jgi:hypothetical protein